MAGVSMASAGSRFADGYWTSADGLKLHYRDYAGDPARPPLLCIAGLTRNARDFEGLAARYAGRWRVICAELRGRGESEYSKDPETYVPATYVADLLALLEQADLSRFVVVGTSLGGLLTMVLGTLVPERIAGAVLNDVGPVVEAEGLGRIRTYVGQGRSFPTWMHAARAAQETLGATFPEFSVTDWLRHVKRTMTVGGNGRIVFDYDMKIAEPFNRPGKEAPPDLWPAFEALARHPLLLVRGERSDILSAATAAEMASRAPGIELVTVPRVGHAPTLEEPMVVEAIDRLLAKIS